LRHGRHTVVDAGLVEVEVGGDLLAGANGLHPAPLRLVEVAVGGETPTKRLSGSMLSFRLRVSPGRSSCSSVATMS
jgi:hypothetical protein